MLICQDKVYFTKQSYKRINIRDQTITTEYSNLNSK